jgi:RNA polymerase sigma-70 factor (ECF subfamily)
MTDDAREEFERLVGELRPKLHRYCARMAGSAFDGEDIVQDALIRAFTALPNAGVIDNPEGWLFRIAHNTALDFLRRRVRGPMMRSDEDLDMIAAPDPPDQDHEVAAMSLRTFMRLPALQRSAVILKDVLGHSLEEIASITGASEAAAKSALQRGRVRLREIAREPADVSLPMLSDVMRVRLIKYVEGSRPETSIPSALCWPTT